MGRAGRPNSKKEVFDPLSELREEGLPEGWAAYWQGERGDVGLVEASPAFSSVDEHTVQRLCSEPVPARERSAILRSIDWDKPLADDDPVVEALWEQEWLRIEKLLRQIADHGSTTLDRLHLPKDDLRKKWFAVWDASYMTAALSRDPQKLQTSLLGMCLQSRIAILEDRKRDDLLRYILRSTYLDKDRFNDFVINDLMPAYADYPPSEEVALGSSVDISSITRMAWREWAAQDMNDTLRRFIIKPEETFQTLQGTRRHDGIGNPPPPGLADLDRAIFSQEFLHSLARRTYHNKDTDKDTESTIYALAEASRAATADELHRGPLSPKPTKDLPKIISGLIGEEKWQEYVDRSAPSHPAYKANADLAPLWSDGSLEDWKSLVRSRTTLPDLVARTLGV